MGRPAGQTHGHRLGLVTELLGTSSFCLRKGFFKGSLLCSLICLSAASVLLGPEAGNTEMPQEKLFLYFLARSEKGSSGYLMRKSVWVLLLLGWYYRRGSKAKKYFTNKSYEECFYTSELSRGGLEISQMNPLFTATHELAW